ncbi:phosphatase PAP2 family protein [Pseudomonas asturiensis]|uniref:Phosphatase PAP2 family protein n=1 Tax=Pseudomonas asturiensis TaxID=1190415 RepID=A0ABX6HKU6_9PSED|nr:phosphatase PAP2 family protein [Pseudomonas asturiensis]QHF05879.1 phosphatase PAP2 family protein [Pseudomonas asturiensis]
MLKAVSAPYSRPLNLWIYLGIPALTALILALLELTSVDMDLAKMAFDPATGEFIGKHSYFLENVLHDRAKQLVIALGLLALISFAASFKVERLIPWRRELGCLVLSMALSTAFVTPVKVVTSVQCPWSLTEFGGQETYSELLSPRPATDKPGRCWPGGHAATGFTLFALFFMLRDRKPHLAKAGLVVAFSLGSIFSVGRMLQGAHFLSHNIWTAVFCWLICLGVYYFVLYRPAPKPDALSTTRPSR